MTLKELLIEKNVTQKKLAKETGISTSTISNYVSGATNISKRNLKKIADYEGFEHKFYSYVQIYNHIYDELPNINEIRETDLLPLLILTDEEKKEIETEEKRCFAYFEYFCIRDFKKKYYTVIGNKKTEDLKVEKSLDWFDFSDFEDDIIEYYNCWKHD